MPPLPKRKLSKGRRDRRRAHDALKPVHLVECPQCHKPHLPHRACPECGTYRGRTVIAMDEAKK
ncbi:MAG: 50S ribosomal protein L32 [Caldilineales bacterium]|nr:50S ribosomal protein L32 [Caldilineales bacterium]MDW8318115.1 50S ribosomal protein L32 [Anaerolineae bacterium]